MKSFILTAVVLLLGVARSMAQTDTLFVKGDQQILGSKLKEKADQYYFIYRTADNQMIKTRLLRSLVDSVRYFVPVMDTNTTAKARRKAKRAATERVENSMPRERAWTYSAAFGINLGNILEFNNPTGTDKKTFTLNTSLDLGLRYRKTGRRFELTNELHYLFGIQKEGLSGGTHLQRVQDDLTTLHDLSFGLGKGNKWNFNVIVRSATSVFEIFDGDYFKNFTSLGRTKGFASPYDITVSPGIKYQPNEVFRVSLSPYSFQLYGVKNHEIAQKGIYITDLDAAGNYKNFLYKRMGAEVNFWFDKRVKEWLDMQYRLSFSSDYFEKFGKNGQMDGLFITKIKVIKDIYLTHRLSLKNDLAGNLLKPYFNQSVMLSYARSF